MYFLFLHCHLHHFLCITVETDASHFSNPFHLPQTFPSVPSHLKAFARECYAVHHFRGNLSTWTPLSCTTNLHWGQLPLNHFCKIVPLFILLALGSYLQHKRGREDLQTSHTQTSLLRRLGSYVLMNCKPE